SHADPTLLNNFKLAAEENGDPPVPDLWTMVELCQPSLNGRGRPITPISIKATNFGHKNDMIQQSIKENGVTDDALHLYLFPHSLTHHATAWFDRLPRNSINTFEQMAKMFLRKYFPPSMVTKLRNEITNFYQRPEESLFEAWEHYKISIDRCPNHNMFLITQIDTFYNGLTLRHHDTINAAAGETFMKRRPEEFYDLIENMTAHHNDWDTSTQRITVGQTQNVYAAGAYEGNSYQPQDALILMPKFGLTIKTLLTNKDKLSELARTPLNEHCSTVLLKKFPEKLGDLGKFLIPCDFLEMAECLALADLGASINLMPLSVWNKLSLPELSPTCMTLELADHLISRRLRSPKMSSLKWNIPFPGRLRELALHVGKEAITFNLDQTSRYLANYNDMTANRIDVIDMACEEYSQEVLGFSDVIVSGNPTPYYDLIVSTTSPTLSPFRESDFLLEEVDAFLALEDDATSPEVVQSYFDPEGDILLLEAFLNDDPSLPPQNQGNYMPQVRKELKFCEAKTDKSSIDEPLEVELKDLPPHLEYAFLEGDDKFPIIISKDLSVEEKTALITVLKSHKRAIA
nr:reverse transcriptase domain-containing protein [Tanacetum cinerariifolium]